jgi:Rrf2 family protein
MQLTRSGDYAVRGMIYLAMQPENGVSQIKEVSETQEIPRNLLNKIFQSLVKTGLVRSHRGSKGGFSLVKPPREITLKEIIEKVEGPIYLNKCLIRKGECSREGICPAHEVWQEAQRKMLEVLERTSLQELAQKSLRFKPLR